MDTTGSMGGYINSATQHIRSIVENIVISEKVMFDWHLLNTEIIHLR